MEDRGLDLQGVVGRLREARQRWRRAHHGSRELLGRELPSREELARVAHDLSAALFPMRLGPPDLRPETEDAYVTRTLDLALSRLGAQVALEIGHAARSRGEAALRAPEHEAQRLVGAFAQQLPELRATLDTDVLAAWRGDPAARSVDEVLLCYPGLRALISHRLAHALHALGAPLVARVIAELAHGDTGIDIHPGARIGAGLFIDHGTGVVIGETAVIGERVRLYQNVTLGARSFPADEDGSLTKGLPRHPIVGDDVVIYAGATILGRVSIGAGSVIGGNVWLTRSVPPGSHVTQAAAQAERPGAEPPAAPPADAG